MNELEITTNIPTTKAGIAQRAADLAETLSANEEPLTALVKLRALRAILDDVLARLESDAITAAEYEGRNTNRLGVTIAVHNGRTLYAYDHDAKWQAAKTAEATAAAERKNRENLLRTLKDEMIDPDTGEIISPAEVRGWTKTAVAVTFPK